MAILIPTNGTHDTQIRFANTIKALFRKKNNLRQFAGTDYEGSPTSGSVRIPVRDTEVVVGDYDIVAGGSLGTSATVYIPVLVNKNKFINELIDGQEAASVPDAMIAQRLASGSFSLQRTQELDFIAALRDSTVAQDTGGGQINTANPTYETSVTVLTNTTAYNAVSASIGTMIDNGVDPQDIKVAISTATETLLLEDIKYTNAASEIGSERAMSGVVGIIRGVEVVRSSNLATVAAAGANVALDGTTVEYMVFSPLWAQAGDEWKVMPSINDLKDGVHIGSSALQAREAYFNALTDTRGCIVKART